MTLIHADWINGPPGSEPQSSSILVFGRRLYRLSQNSCCFSITDESVILTCTRLHSSNMIKFILCIGHTSIVMFGSFLCLKLLVCVVFFLTLFRTRCHAMLLGSQYRTVLIIAYLS